jgi:uncharacterized membrane protein
MSIVVVLNNYFHDFSVAILVSCLLVIVYLERRMKDRPAAQAEFFTGLYRALKPVMTAAWIFIVIGGIVRTLTYEKYEWSEAAGRGQVAALIVKHVLLIALVLWGVVLQRRVSRRLRATGEAEVRA